MSDLLESAVREAFFAEAQLAPEPGSLARVVRRRARRRPLVVGTAGVASMSLAVGLAIANPFAPTQGVSSAHGEVSFSGERSCVEAYLPVTLKERAFAFDGTVTHIVPKPDAAGLALVAVTFDVHEWFRGGDGSTVTIEMNPPARVQRPSMDELFDSYGVGTRLLVSGEPRWPGRTPAEPIAWACGFTRYYDAATAESWRETFAR